MTTKLDDVVERLRRLPPDRQDALAGEIDVLLEDEGAGGSLLTDEQWAEVEEALADPSEPVASHEDVFARLRTRG
ncbi:MAG: hypothetical protein JNJ73_00775 [Hyphomonadaceae bacterium]|nr:hypothetical protein [Hyphomonadaceae bacterium]